MAHRAYGPSTTEKLVTLRQLHGMLEESIKELDDERRTEKFAEKGLLVARFTKATCDAFVGMAGALAQIFLVGKGAKLVTSSYETIAPVAEAGSSKIFGGPGFTTKALASAAKGASSFLPENGEILAKSFIVKGEIINAAMHTGPKEILPLARDYVVDLHIAIAKLESMPKKSKHLADVAEVMKRAVEYNRSLGETFDEIIDIEEEDEQRYLALKATLIRQAKMISHKIAALERQVHSMKVDQTHTTP
jgi:hypothetical protein